MKCPKCAKEIGLVEQTQEWDKAWGNEAGLPAMFMLICENCKEQTAMVEIIPIDNFEEVESPLGKVKLPKFN